MSAFQPVQLKKVVRAVGTWNPLKAGADETFRYIDLSAVDQASKRIIGAREISCGEAPSRARQLVEQDDVLVATVRPNLNGVAIVPPELHKATASTGFCVVRPDPEKLVPNYLFHWVKTEKFVSAMVKQATGASYPAVSDKIVLGSSIPLPSLPEQRRIAAILDKADALRATSREALAQLDSLTQSIFVEMFGDPTTNPKNWQRMSLTDTCEAINDCPHSTPEWAESGFVCLRTSNLTRGGWDWSDKRFVSEVTFQDRSKRGYIRAGDIILSREGTVGIAAIVQPGMTVCMGQRLVQVRCNEEWLASEYLLHHLLHVLEPSRISRLMVGSTAQHLNVRELKSLTIPCPPLELQIAFAVRIKSINALKASHRELASAMEKLATAIQHRAFRGEL